MLTKKSGFCLDDSGDMLKNLKPVGMEFGESEKFTLSGEDGAEDLNTGAGALSEGDCGHSWKETGAGTKAGVGMKGRGRPGRLSRKEEQYSTC